MEFAFFCHLPSIYKDYHTNPKVEHKLKDLVNHSHGNEIGTMLWFDFQLKPQILMPPRPHSHTCLY